MNSMVFCRHRWKLILVWTISLKRYSSWCSIFWILNWTNCSTGNTCSNFLWLSPSWSFGSAWMSFWVWFSLVICNEKVLEVKCLPQRKECSSVQTGFFLAVLSSTDSVLSVKRKTRPMLAMSIGRGKDGNNDWEMLSVKGNTQWPSKWCSLQLPLAIHSSLLVDLHLSVWTLRMLVTVVQAGKSFMLALDQSPIKTVIQSQTIFHSSNIPRWMPALR